jgi:hypothetical protein
MYFRIFESDEFGDRLKNLITKVKKQDCKMSYLTEINCTTILEAIKIEKLKQRKETENESSK